MHLIFIKPYNTEHIDTIECQVTNTAVHTITNYACSYQISGETNDTNNKDNYRMALLEIDEGKFHRVNRHLIENVHVSIDFEK